MTGTFKLIPVLMNRVHITSQYFADNSEIGGSHFACSPPSGHYPQTNHPPYSLPSGTHVLSHGAVLRCEVRLKHLR